MMDAASVRPFRGWFVSGVDRVILERGWLTRYQSRFESLEEEHRRCRDVNGRGSIRLVAYIEQQLGPKLAPCSGETGGCLPHPLSISVLTI